MSLIAKDSAMPQRSVQITFQLKHWSKRLDTFVPLRRRRKAQEMKQLMQEVNGAEAAAEAIKEHYL